MRLNSFEKAGLSLLQAFMVMGWLIILLNGVQVAIAQWVSHGLEGRSITALAIDSQTPARLYAGTADSGVYKSSDSGESWAAINSGLPSAYYVWALVVDPQTPPRCMRHLMAACSRAVMGGKAGVRSTTG